jgi:gluconate 2-dehydrogenase subunit 3-like protein
MADIDRRTLLKLISSAPVAAGFAWTDVEAHAAHAHAQAARATAQRTRVAFKPKFFTAHEYATVRVLVDLIIPKDDRSGSATDAGVPEFMDFMMGDQPNRQTAMRGGLAWIDRECLKRYDKPMVACAATERTAVLDDISWPRRGTPEMSHGISFFTSFRDLTASGFWTTKMGIDDLQYIGNTMVPEWKGCPDDVLKKLGLPTE